MLNNPRKKRKKKSKGYVLLHKEIQYSRVCHCPHMFRLYTILLLRANYRERRMRNGLVIKRGQCRVSIHGLAREFHCSRNTLKDALKSLVEFDRIRVVEKSRKGTIIEISDYDEYQKGWV